MFSDVVFVTLSLLISRESSLESVKAIATSESVIILVSYCVAKSM